MTTEEEIRQLLAKAAATIEVDESAPMTLTGLPEPRPRRWPVLAAAAAVVLAIGGGVLVSQQLGDDPQPSPAVPDGAPVEGPYPLADDQLPSILGYTEHEAVELLEAKGLNVTVERFSTGCLPDGAIVTEPGTGTRVADGDQVTLRVGDHRAKSSFGPIQGCFDAKVRRQLGSAWDLIRFARGLGGAPRFAEELTLYAGDSEPRRLTAADAVDPDNWTVCDASACHSALRGIQQVVSQPWPLTSGEFATPYFNWSTTIQDAEACGYSPDPVGGRHKWVVWVHVEVGMNDWCRPPMQVQIHFDDSGAISAVGLRIRPGYNDDPAEIAAVSASREAAAEAFVAWARGKGPAPEFADRVRVMYGGGGAFGSTGWVEDPETRSAYGGCSGLGFPDCPVDPVALLVRYDGPVVPTAGRSTCADGGEVPTRFAAAEQDVVRLEEPEPASCRSAWAVELWIDEGGVIYGVNQAGAG